MARTARVIEIARRVLFQTLTGTSQPEPSIKGSHSSAAVNSSAPLKNKADQEHEKAEQRASD